MVDKHNLYGFLVVQPIQRERREVFCTAALLSGPNSGLSHELESI